MKDQGAEIRESKSGLDFQHPAPIKISARRKAKTSSTQYITAEEVKEGESEDDVPPHRGSVFDRLSPPHASTRSSVFERLAESEDDKKERSKAQRLSLKSHPCKKKSSVLSRIGTSNQAPERQHSVFSRIKKLKQNAQENEADARNDVRSTIPSSMKRIQKVEIT